VYGGPFSDGLPGKSCRRFLVRILAGEPMEYGRSAVAGSERIRDGRLATKVRDTGRSARIGF